MPPDVAQAIQQHSAQNGWAPTAPAPSSPLPSDVLQSIQTHAAKNGWVAPSSTLPPDVASAIQTHAQKNGWLPQPSTQSATAPPSFPALDPLIHQAATKWGVPGSLISAIIQHESGGQNLPANPEGAAGVAQFIHSTAKEYGVDPMNPASSIDGMGHYLSDLLKRNGGNIEATVKDYSGYGVPHGSNDAYVNGVMRMSGLGNSPAENRPVRAPQTPAAMFRPVAPGKHSPLTPTLTPKPDIAGQLQNALASNVDYSTNEAARNADTYYQQQLNSPKRTAATIVGAGAGSALSQLPGMLIHGLDIPAHAVEGLATGLLGGLLTPFKQQVQGAPNQKAINTMNPLVRSLGTIGINESNAAQEHFAQSVGGRDAQGNVGSGGVIGMAKSIKDKVWNAKEWQRDPVGNAATVAEIVLPAIFHGVEGAPEAAESAAQTAESAGKPNLAKAIRTAATQAKPMPKESAGGLKPGVEATPGVGVLKPDQPNTEVEPRTSNNVPNEAQGEHTPIVPQSAATVKPESLGEPSPVHVVGDSGIEGQSRNGTKVPHSPELSTPVSGHTSTVPQSPAELAAAARRAPNSPITTDEHESVTRAILQAHSDYVARNPDAPKVALRFEEPPVQGENAPYVPNIGALGKPNLVAYKGRPEAVVQKDIDTLENGIESKYGSNALRDVGGDIFERGQGFSDIPRPSHPVDAATVNNLRSLYAERDADLEEQKHSDLAGTISKLTPDSLEGPFHPDDIANALEQLQSQESLWRKLGHPASSDIDRITHDLYDKLAQNGTKTKPDVALGAGGIYGNYPDALDSEHRWKDNGYGKSPAPYLKQVRSIISDITAPTKVADQEPHAGIVPNSAEEPKPEPATTTPRTLGDHGVNLTKTGLSAEDNAHLQSVVDANKDKIEAQRRGVQTWEQTKAAAAGLDATWNKYELVKPGQAFNAEEMLRLRDDTNATIQSAKRARVEAQYNPTPENQALADKLTDREAHMVSIQHGAIAESGRGQQALRVSASADRGITPVERDIFAKQPDDYTPTVKSKRLQPGQRVIRATDFSRNKLVPADRMAELRTKIAAQDKGCVIT